MHILELNVTFWHCFRTIWVFLAFYAVLSWIRFVVVNTLFWIKLFRLKPCLCKKSCLFPSLLTPLSKFIFFTFFFFKTFSLTMQLTAVSWSLVLRSAWLIWDDILVLPTLGLGVVAHLCQLKKTRCCKTLHNKVIQLWWFICAKAHMRHCKLVHQSQSPNCAIFTSHIWSILWKTNILFFP